MDNITQAEFKNKSALSVKALMEKRELIQRNKKRMIDIEVDEIGVFKFRIPDFYDIEDSNQTDNGDAYIVYSCAVEPSLKDAELQKAYGVKMPVDIVLEIFKPGQIVEITKTLLQAAGYKDETVRIVETIKNE